jgi:hypothetical protein
MTTSSYEYVNQTALGTMLVNKVHPVKLLVKNGQIPVDWRSGKIVGCTDQLSSVNCNDDSINFLFRLIVFIHFVAQQ